MYKPPSYPTKCWFGWLIFALGASFYSYEYLLRVLPGTMTSALMHWHGLNPEQLGWFASSYYITYTLMQVPVGLLLDRFNPKYVLLAAVSACLIGNAAFGVNSLAIAITGRVLVGLGSAFAYVGVLRLATVWLPTSQFGLAAGLVNTVGMIGGMIADVVLNPVVVKLGAASAVHLATWLGLPILLALLIVPHQPKTLPLPNAPPQLALAWRQLLMGLCRVAMRPWLWVNALIGCALYIPLSIFAELWGIAYLETTQHLAATRAGEVIAWLLLGMAVGTPLAGGLIAKYSHPFRIIIVGASVALGLILVLLYGPFSNPWLLSLMLFLFGVASGVQVLVIVLAKSVANKQEQGTTMAFTNMLIILGGMLFQPLVGALLKAQGTVVNHVIVYSAYAYQRAMLVVPAALACSILLVIILKYLSRPYTQQSDTISLPSPQDIAY